ncbi:hypothetical protein ACHAWO_008250 [Cyclotella atomus]|uniref:Rhodanese domain-containing protein n=1 Tax=Cyclotella atomus TaxID=382360 RepID=A0ABD3P4A2_9STRA
MLHFTSTKTSATTHINMDNELIITENARPVCHKALPTLDPSICPKSTGSILLFYQYIEPEWTKAQHKSALKKVIEIGTKFNITGRGRVAREGLNCTLTGKPNDLRSFCYGLREWDDVFNETDFKITDGVPLDKMFKSLSIRKTNELVAYGLVGEKAPSLKQFGGTHLEADEYHEAMKDPEAVIIDVRNAYESAIGHFQPPETGAKLIDPKMRNSIEFPKWLNSEETKKQLEGKKVLMYCTGGIRCERATALLNQMTAVSDDLNLKGVYHCRGGIERYVKTYQEGGGYWKGKNYLFDRRMEQTPQIKDSEKVENEIDSKCCLCRAKWTVYRGQFKCHSTLCGVPVIVCDSCARIATAKPHSLKCELCQTGYRAPTEAPDLIEMKRKADKMLSSTCTNSDAGKKMKSCYNDRIFLSRLPLTATFTKVKEALGPEGVVNLKWLTDKSNGGFYGSAIVLLSTPETTQNIIQKASAKSAGIKVDRKKIKVKELFVKDDQGMFHGLEQKEFPPIGTC